MSELTDNDLEVAVAEAMGWRHVHYALGLLAMEIDFWFRLDGSRIETTDFHPLEVDANGNPTQRAAAQLWGILGWLIEHLGYSLRCSKPVHGWSITWSVDPIMCVMAQPTFARAVCEAAVAVGNATP